MFALSLASKQTVYVAEVQCVADIEAVLVRVFYSLSMHHDQQEY